MCDVVQFVLSAFPCVSLAFSQRLFQMVMLFFRVPQLETSMSCNL